MGVGQQEIRHGELLVRRHRCVATRLSRTWSTESVYRLNDILTKITHAVVFDLHQVVVELQLIICCE